MAKDAAAKASVTLLEPIVALTVLVPDEHVGAVIADISTRRGMIKGTESVAGGRSRVVADVPESPTRVSALRLPYPEAQDVVLWGITYRLLDRLQHEARE